MGCSPDILLIPTCQQWHWQWTRPVSLHRQLSGSTNDKTSCRCCAWSSTRAADMLLTRNHWYVCQTVSSHMFQRSHPSTSNKIHNDKIIAFKQLQGLDRSDRSRSRTAIWKPNVSLIHTFTFQIFKFEFRDTNSFRYWNKYTSQYILDTLSQDLRPVVLCDL